MIIDFGTNVNKEYFTVFVICEIEIKNYLCDFILNKMLEFSSVLQKCLLLLSVLCKIPNILT